MSREKQNIVWKLIAQMVLLLVLYAAATLMTAVKFLANDPLSLPYAQISGFSHILLDLTILSGLIAAALNYVVGTSSSLLKWTFRGWTILLVLAVLAAALGLLEGRHMLELPFVLDILLIVLLILWFMLIWQGSRQSEAKIVFLLSLAFIIVAFALSLIPVSNPAQDRLMRVLTVDMRFFVGYGLGALAVISWLKGNEASAFFSAGIWLLVGTIVSLIPLNAIGIIHFPTIITFLIILLGMLIVANQNIIQGQRWVNFGLLFFLIGMGLLGATLSVASVGQFAIGTQMNGLMFSLVEWAVIAVLLGAASQWLEGTRSYSKINAVSWTFKLMVAGLLASHVVLLLVAVLQMYLERIMSVGYLDTQVALIPLDILWITASLVWAIGVAMYANRYLGSGNHLLEA